MRLGIICWVVSLILTESLVSAQKLDPKLYNERDVRIQSLLKEESYAEAVKAIAVQLEYLRDSGVYDSLYHYVYDYGLSVRKTEDTEQSEKRTESLYHEILKFDRDTSHWLSAMEDLSLTYYEIGEGPKRFEIDKAFLELAQQYSKATPVKISIGHYNLGFNSLEQGKPSDAIHHFQSSVDVLDSENPSSTRRLVNGWNAIGATLWRTGQMDKAKSAFQKSLHYIKQLEDPYVVLGNRSNCLGNLSLIFQDEGQLITAKKYLLEGIEARKQALALNDEDEIQNHQHRKMLISNYRNLAAIYLDMGDHSRALRITEHLYGMQKELLEPGDPSMALTDESFGSIYAAMEKYPEALEHLNRYTSYCESHFGRENFYSGTAYKRLGNIYLDQGDYSAALSALNEAIYIFHSISEDGYNQDLPGSYLFRSRTYGYLGDWENAIADNWSAINLYQKMRKKNDPRIGEAFLALAQLHRNFNRLDSAKTAIDKALQILVNYQDEIAESTQQNFQNPVLYLPKAYLLKAQLTLLQRDSDSTDSIAANLLDRAIVTLRNNKSIYEGEEAQLGLYEAHEMVFNLALDICYKRYKNSGDRKFIEKMLALNEERRTLLLRRQLSAFGSVQYFGVPDSVVSKERTLLGKLTGKYTIADSSENYRDIEAEYLKLKAQIERDHPEYFALRFQESTADIAAIRSNILGSDHSMLQYISTDNQLYVLVVGPEESELIQLSKRGLSNMIERYNHFIKHMEVEPFAQVSASLYRLLFEPIADYINSTNLLIVPDDDLFSVNFETLIRPSQSKKLQYLIYDYNISYLLSATTAVKFNQLQPQNKSGLLAFAPGFSDQLKQSYLDQSPDTSLFDQHYLHCIQQPFAVRAAQNVVGLMSGQAFTGSEATEQQFKERSSHYKVIHLGTHAQINNDSPMLSRLILAKEANDSAQSEDGYLHAYEIYNMPLRAELAVLTACETGVGQENQSEGVLSLSHSFTYAGCPSIIMSLWQIDEKTSSEIIEDFYEFLSEGMSKSEALRQAKLDYLQTADAALAAPYFWAGMVLVGNPTPISSPSHNVVWWILGLSISLFLVIAIARKARK